jgi:opacity protein-like surface antigen
VVPRWLCSVFWTLLFLGSGCLVVLPVRAAEYVVTPSLTLRETYDDNVYFEDSDDFEHLIAPALELEAQTDRARVQTACSWNISKYRRRDELDSVQQAYQLSGTLSPSTLLQLNLSGRYAYDYTFTSTLEESGLVAERSRRSSVTVQPGATIVVTPRNTLELSYQFNKTRYDLERYGDYVGHGLNFSLSHALRNERSRLIFVLSGNEATFDQNDEDVRQRTCQAQTGVDHQWTETFQVTLTAGASYTESKSVEREEEATAFVMNGALNWLLEPMTLSVSVNRGIVPSIYGEVTTSDRVGAVLGYRLSERVQCTLSTAYYRSETEGLVEDARWHTYSAQPSLTYNFMDNMNLQLGYAYIRTENETTDESQDQNRFFVQVSSAWPSTID